MRPTTRKTYALVLSAFTAVTVGFAASSPGLASGKSSPPHHATKPAVRVFHGAMGDLSGIVEPIARRTLWIAVAHENDRRALLAIADAERRAAEARSRPRPSRASSGPSTGSSVVTGSCAAMKPAGFPDSIIQRESRGNPNARNGSGAYGCAQLMPMHLTGNYAADWSRLWNNGAGACNWSPPNYCAGR